MKAKYLANNILAPHSEPDRKKHCANPFYPRFWPQRLKELQKAKSWMYREGNTGVTSQNDAESKGIFVCNMCEFFGDWVPTEWQIEVFKAIKANRQHRFYFLTKQPQNVGKFGPFPDNCWVGVTVCDKEMVHNMWMNYFSQAKATVRFISFEPLLDDVSELPIHELIIRNADWVIIGSQTKPYNPPKVEWIQAIVEIADKYGVPVFLKDNLKSLLGNNLRQELPYGNRCSDPNSNITQ